MFEIQQSDHCANSLKCPLGSTSSGHNAAEGRHIYLIL